MQTNQLIESIHVKTRIHWILVETCQSVFDDKRKNNCFAFCVCCLLINTVVAHLGEQKLMKVESCRLWQHQVHIETERSRGAYK